MADQNQEQNQEQQQQYNPEQMKQVLEAVESLKQQNQLLQQQVSQQQQPKQAEVVEEEDDSSEQSLRDILGMEKASEKIAKKGVDELSNQELVEAMSMAVDQLVQTQRQAATKEVNGTIQQLNKRIEAIQGAVMNMAVQSDIKSCRERYSDFDSHSKDIQAELNVTPGLSLEKAYLLVKAAKASRTPSNRITETEKPTDALTDAAGSDNDEEDYTPPQQRQNNNKQRPMSTSTVASFRQALDEAVNKVVSARHRKGTQ